MTTIKQIIDKIETEVNDTFLTKDERQVFPRIAATIKELEGRGVTGKSMANMDADELYTMGSALALDGTHLNNIWSKLDKAYNLEKLKGNMMTDTRRDGAIKALETAGERVTERAIEAKIAVISAKHEFLLAHLQGLIMKTKNLNFSMVRVLNLIEVRLNRIDMQRRAGKMDGDTPDLTKQS